MRRPCLAFAFLGLMLWTLAGCAAKGPAQPEVQTEAAQAHFGQAMTLKDAGQPEQAAQQLQRALQADPDMYPAYYQLGLIYRETGRPDVARQVWETGVKRAMAGPDRPEYPRERSLAEMRAALVGLETAPPAPAIGASELPKPPPAPEAQAKATTTSSGQYAVLFSSNLKKTSADGDVKLLEAKGYQAQVKTITIKGKKWLRVIAVCCTSKAEAQANAKKIQAATGRRGVSVIKQ